LVTVTVAGELDASTAPGLEAAISAALRLARHTVVIDTTDVVFGDAVGRRSLRRRDAPRAAGVQVVLVRGDAIESFDRRLAHLEQGDAQAA
jgi:anti-anti-sigma factor